MISWLEKHNKISWSITIIIAVLIFYISSLTFPPAEPGSPGINAILYHIIAFFFLTFFLLISLVRGKKKTLLIPSIILSLVYAFSDEFHQSFVPGRSSSLFDVFLDGVGITFALLLYLILLVYRK